MRRAEAFVSCKRFFEQFEAQIAALRDAEALVAVWKRLEAAGAAIAAPFVPGDQLVADRDDGHFHHRTPPLRSRQALGFAHHLPADAATLQGRLDREHAEIAGVALPLEMAAGEQFARARAAAALGQQDAAARLADEFADAGDIDALAVEHVGFGRPADPAGVAAI